jgi:hypothetical protein
MKAPYLVWWSLRGAGKQGLACLCAAMLLSGGLAQAQDDARAKDMEALRATMQQLEKALQDARAKMAELEQQYGTTGTNAALAGTTHVPSASGSNYVTVAEQKIPLPATPADLSAYGRSQIPDHDTFNDLQPAAPRPDNKPIDPALKGFIPIPGTKTMIRFGGSARLDTIYDFEDNGNPNQFIPSSIPVDGQPGADGGERSQIHTKGTRISFETRRPVGEEGTLRIYNENDFFDNSTSSSMSFRVRHFYGQAWNLTIGQTFSAFMNIDSWPDVLDYAGPNALMNRRQPQIRFSPPIYEGVGEMHLLFSLEQPDSDLNLGATGVPAGADIVSRVPDGVVGWRWEGSVGHVQLASLFRSIGYEVDNGPDDSVFGWGASASGAFNVFKKDKLFWQVAYGEGMARYVNDLGGGDLDAAPDATGNLEALPVFAGALGYTHHWSEQFRSTISYGQVHVDPTASLGGLALEDTQYTSLNLVWHPTMSFRMGLEYLYGFKDTESGADGEGHRLNFVLRYDLIR